MKMIMLIFIGCVGWSIFAQGGELIHKWKSPSFSGIGTSAHFLTIENQEFTRKAEIRAKKIFPKIGMEYIGLPQNKCFDTCKKVLDIL